MSDILAIMYIDHALQHAEARADLTDNPAVRERWLNVAHYLRQAAHYATVPGYRIN